MRVSDIAESPAWRVKREVISDDMSCVYVVWAGAVVLKELHVHAWSLVTQKCLST